MLEAIAAEQPQVARLPHPVPVQDHRPRPGPVAVPEEIGMRAAVGLAVTPALGTGQVDRWLVLADERQVLEVDSGAAPMRDANPCRQARDGMKGPWVVDR